MTIRRLYLLLTIAVVAAAVMGLSGTALAAPPVDSGNPSCFGNAARSEPDRPTPPGAGVSEFTTSVTGSGQANPVNDAAQEVGPIQHVRSDVCPESGPFPEQ